VPFDKPSDLSLTGQPTDPWAFFLRLNRIITANTSSKQLLEDFFSLLHTVPEIEASWFGSADAAGKIHTTISYGTFGERYRVVETLAEVIHGPSMTGPAARAWLSGDPQYCADWRGDPAVKMFQESSAELNWASSAAVPLCGRAGPHAILAIYSNKRGFFPDVWSVEVLAQLGAVIGNALENREKQAILWRTQQLYQTLFHGATELLSSKSDKQIIKLLCKNLVESGLFLSASVGQVGKDNMHSHLVTMARHNPRFLRNAVYKHVKGEPCAPLSVLAWEAGRTMVANNYRADPRFKPVMHVAEKVGFESVAAFIIPRNGKRWAVMSATSDQPYFFDDDLVKLLEQLASMVGHRLDELDLKAALRTEREAQSQIARQDVLTALPNQLAFDEHLRGSMARAVRHKTIAGVGLIDIDRFKQFNESWGTAAGDIVLKETASRLRKMLREIDFVARTGGDEFAVIMEDWSWTHDIEGLCARLHEVLNAPITIAKDVTVQITISAGFTLYPMDNGSARQLLRHASMALFAARAGRGRFEKFWRLYMDIADGTKDLFAGRSLLSRGALKVHYQPVMNLRSGKIVSVEALARLDDGSRLIMPGKFLKDLLLDDRVLLFRQVLEAALTQIKLWDGEGIHLNISVNVDAQILLLDRTLPYLARLLEDSKLEPRRLVLEILETHDFVDLERARMQLEAIRALGVRIALDDLGAGYSSILKVRELPLDVVKLDRKFIASLSQQPDDLMFISVFQTLTKSLGMDLVVEGVETEDVMDALRMMGAHQAQGYFITKPMSAAQLSVWLHAFQPVAQPNEPTALLGAYAVHLTWLRAFQFARTEDALLKHLRTNDPFPLTQFLADNDYLDKPLGRAYLNLQATLHDPESSRASILEASGAFRAELITALTS
jgi:diguanylate cyclase (GGDEF)-like protein